MSGAPRGFSRHCRCQAGFSLLEALVAFSIMMLSLGALYQALGGGIRNLIVAERQTHAVLLAESLRSLHHSVPPGGLQATGNSGDGFDWSLVAVPAVLSADDAPAAPWQLYQLDITVVWQDRGRQQQYRISTLLPEGMEQTAAR